MVKKLLCIALSSIMKTLILITKSSKHSYLAQNIRPLYLYRWGWSVSPTYPPQRKEDINEEDSLTVRI